MLTQPIKKELIDLVERYSPSSEIRDSPYEIQLKHNNGLWVTITEYQGTPYYSFCGLRTGEYFSNSEKFIIMWDKLKQFDASWETLTKSAGMGGQVYQMWMEDVRDIVHQEPYYDMIRINLNEDRVLEYTLLSLDLRFGIYRTHTYIKLDGYVVPFIAYSLESLFPTALVRQYKLNQFIN
jgi:hypothetical protein